MFGRFFVWLRSFFRTTDDVGLYALRERLIYRYFDGQKEVRVDPLVQFRKIADILPSLSINLKVMVSPSKDALVCHAKAVQQIRELFAVPHFDEGGLTEAELFALFNHFWSYAESIKKNSRPSATSPDATSGDFGPSWVENQPTSNSSASGSTAADNSTETATPSPTEPPSPPEASNPASDTTSP